MINVIWDQGFKKSYKKKIKNNSELKKRFWTALKAFSNEPFDPQVKTHKLTGKINYPAAEQRGILKSIERPKGRGLVCLRQDRTLVRLWRIERILGLQC